MSKLDGWAMSNRIEITNCGWLEVSSTRGGGDVTVIYGGLSRGHAGGGNISLEDAPAVAHLCASFSSHAWRMNGIACSSDGHIVLDGLTSAMGIDEERKGKTWKVLGEAIKGALEYTKKPRFYRQAVSGDGFAPIIVQVTDIGGVSLSSMVGPHEVGIVLAIREAVAIRYLTTENREWTANGMTRGPGAKMSFDGMQRPMSRTTWTTLGSAIQGAIEFIEKEAT